MLEILHAAQKLREVVKTRRSIDDVVAQTNMSRLELKKFVNLAKMKEEEIILNNLRLIYSIARMYTGRGLEFEDLVYEGIRGVRKALTKFDFDRGLAFSTYAYPWIKDYMRSALAAAHPIKLPRHVYKLAVKVNAIKGRLFRKSGVNPSDEDLANELGISMDRFDIVRRAMDLVNRDADSMTAEKNADKPTAAPYDESTWEKVLDDTEAVAFSERLVSSEPQPHIAAGYNNVQQTMIAALRILPKQEATAVLNRLGLGNPTKSNETNLAVAPEEEKALYRRGLRKLRKVMLGDPIFSDLDTGVEMQAL
jgi:RNA polymerase primary sigma factor